MATLVNNIMLFFSVSIFIYMLIVITIYSVMGAMAFWQIRHHRHIDKDANDQSIISSIYSKPVSIIVPAYNEEMGIVGSVRSIANLKYPQFEIIVVNDGSKDATKEVLIEHFQMVPVQKIIKQQLKTKEINQVYESTIQPNLILIDKENGGKSDAMNAGINVSEYPYFCTIDADSILEEKSLLWIMRPILMSPHDVIAVGGNVRIGNGNEFISGSLSGVKQSKNLLVITQIIEYLRSFQMGRVALSKINSVLILSGAFSVFNKKWALKVNGYSTNMIGEDMEIIVKLHQYIRNHKLDNRIEYVPDPVCWTEAPQTFSNLRKQRRRWQQGLVDTLRKHKKMTFNPKYGRVGMISFPYFLFIECIGPIIELGGYLFVIVSFFLGSIYIEFAVALSFLLIFYGVVFSMVAVLFEAWSLKKYPSVRDVLRFFLVSILEVFWYKPITLVFRLEGMIRSLLKKTSWGDMKREGLTKGGRSS